MNLSQDELHKLFHSDEMKNIKLEYYNQAYQQGRFDERMESQGTGGLGLVKQIRPTKVIFETEEELQNFMNKVTSTQKDDSEDMKLMRELMENHKSTKRGS